MNGELGPSKLDPFSFGRYGLVGAVIGALFLLVFYLIFAIGKNQQQTNIAITQLIGAVQGFNATVYNMGNSFGDLSRDIQSLSSTQTRPYRPPPWTRRPAPEINLPPGAAASIQAPSTGIE